MGERDVNTDHHISKQRKSAAKPMPVLMTPAPTKHPDSPGDLDSRVINKENHLFPAS